MKQIYWTSNNRFEKGWAHAETENDAKFIGVEVCPRCGRVVSMMKWQRPLKIILSAKKIGDFIFGTLPYPIVSKRFKELYEVSDLRGIKEFRRVDRMRFKKEIIDAEYYYLELERIDVKVKVAQGEFIIEDEISICQLCRPDKRTYIKIKGLLVEENVNMINKDIFLTYLQGDTVFCNERFMQFCKDNKLKNWDTHITHISQYSIGYGF